MRFLLTLSSDSLNAVVQVIRLFVHIDRPCKLAFVTDRIAIGGDSDTKRAILVSVRSKFRLVEDLLEGNTREFVPFPLLGVKISAPFGLPVLLLCCLEFPAFLCIANELRGMEAL